MTAANDPLSVASDLAGLLGGAKPKPPQRTLDLGHAPVHSPGPGGPKGAQVWACACGRTAIEKDGHVWGEAAREQCDRSNEPQCCEHSIEDAKVGDPWHPGWDHNQPCCREEREYGCTRPAGHDGQHVASIPGQVVEVWT